MDSSRRTCVAKWTFLSPLNNDSRVAAPPAGFHWQAERYHAVPTRKSSTLSCSDSDHSGQTTQIQALPGSSWQALKTAPRSKTYKPALTQCEITEAFVEFGALFASEPHLYPTALYLTGKAVGNRPPSITASRPPTEVGAAFPVLLQSSGSTAVGIPPSGIDRKHQDSGTVTHAVGSLAKHLDALSIREDARGTRTFADDKTLFAQTSINDNVSRLPYGKAHKISYNRVSKLASLSAATDATTARKNRQLVLPLLPAAQRPDVERLVIPKHYHSATSSRPDFQSTSSQQGGNASSSKAIRSQPAHGSLAFKAENCIPSGCSCPVGKLGHDVDNCSSQEKKGYVHWRFLKNHQHLGRHMEAGHITPRELHELKSLDASHGLPSPNTKVPEDVAKYFRRAIVTIAIELKDFEALINPYQGWDLCDERTLGPKYKTCLDALRRFKFRRQLEPGLATRGPFALPAVQEQIINHFSPATDLPRQAVRDAVPIGHENHSGPSRVDSSENNLTWLESASATDAEPAQFPSPRNLADDRIERIDALVRGIEGMSDAAEQFQKVGDLADVVSILREQIKTAWCRVRAVNADPLFSHRADNRSASKGSISSSSNRRFRVSKQALKPSQGGTRQHQHVKFHRRNIHVSATSHHPLEDRAVLHPQSFADEASLPLPVIEAQAPLPATPRFDGSSSATDQMLSTVPTSPEPRLADGYIPEFSLAPYAGYDFDIELSGAKSSKTQDSEWEFDLSNCSVWLGLDSHGTTLL